MKTGPRLGIKLEHRRTRRRAFRQRLAFVLLLLGLALGALAILVAYGYGAKGQP